MDEHQHQFNGDRNIITQDMLEETVVPVPGEVNTLFASNFPEFSSHEQIDTSIEGVSPVQEYLLQKEVVNRQKRQNEKRIQKKRLIQR